jgi:predicted alpha/beta hydrolase family esterase
MEDNLILIGHSLGGIFLAKYLSEENLPKKIKAVFLVAAPYELRGNGESQRNLSEFKLPVSLDKFKEQGGEIFLYHSKDDPVVPFSEVEKYQAALLNAKTVIFEDRGHFNQEQFPEIIEAIKGL